MSAAIVGAVVAWAPAALAATKPSACRSGFEVAGVGLATAPGRVAQTSSGDGCRFDVRLCVNVGPADCRARPLAGLASRGSVAEVLRPPSSLDEPGACGEWATIVVPQSGDRRARLRTRAVAVEKNGRRRVRRLSLVCMPAAGPPPTTPPPPPPSPGTRACEGIPIPPRVPGRLIDLPPSLPVASCTQGGLSSNYATPLHLLSPDAAAELHVIGVYEGPEAPQGAPGHGLQPPPPRPSVRVTVDARPKPVVLYLSAYDSVAWEVSVRAGAVLRRLFVQGYEPQQVTGVPAGVDVVALGPDDDIIPFHQWELAEGAAGYVSAVGRIRRRTGLTESSFQGCYTGERFDVPHWDGEAAPCTESLVAGDETLPRRAVTFPGCEHVTAESQYCLTTSGGGLALLGIDSGTVCSLPTDRPMAFYASGPALTWRGEMAYACTYEGLVRISLRDGKSESANMPCGGVAVDAGHLLVAAPSELEPYRSGMQALYAFATWDDLLAGSWASALDLGGFLSRMTVYDGILYEAWHSTDTIERRSLATGEALPPITLDGYDGWILGLSVTGDGRLLVSGDTWGDTVFVFDARTGVMERVVRPTSSVLGLACVDGTPR